MEALFTCFITSTSTHEIMEALFTCFITSTSKHETTEALKAQGLSINEISYKIQNSSGNLSIYMQCYLAQLKSHSESIISLFWIDLHV